MDEAFTQAILETQDDDTPRLVYADWLEEQGETTRVEFIRGQIALARMPQDDPEFTALSSRMNDLLRTHREEWVALLTFSAAAWKCGVRDRWIGWDVRRQYERLKLIANNSRFVILPGWHRTHLGSKPLSFCPQRLGPA